MTGRILPFFVTQSKEKLTDRGSLALVDEFMTGVGFTRQLDQMPGSDAVGDWLRRLGERKGTAYVQRINDTLVRRYVSVSKCKEFILDVDSTVIESNKGDATYCNYKGVNGYHPMLGWLSDGRDEPICSYVKFRQGSASAQTDILEALQHTETLMLEGKGIKYFRSDSAAYQARIIDYCNDNDIYYTITADKDVSVISAIMNIPSTAWQPLHDRRDRFKTGREVAEAIHTMNDSNHSFRLVVIRELTGQPDLFGPYIYYGVITNIPLDGLDAKTSEEVIWHHNGRGNCERYIEDTKYGLTLRYVPCGQMKANAMYYTVGILTFNLLKLMQVMVLPKSWLKKTILSLRRGLFKIVAKVTARGRQFFLQVNKTKEELIAIIRIREKIWALSIQVM